MELASPHVSDGGAASVTSGEQVVRHVRDFHVQGLAQEKRDNERRRMTGR